MWNILISLSFNSEKKNLNLIPLRQCLKSKHNLIVRGLLCFRVNAPFKLSFIEYKKEEEENKLIISAWFNVIVDGTISLLKLRNKKELET